jgi:uncharacterized protein with PQ loop repeat
MPAESVVQAANVCQLAAPFISLVAYFPQWTKLFRTKSSESISIRSWCGWGVSSVFALFYAVVQLLLNGNGWALVISTLLALIFVAFTLFLVVKYPPGLTALQR